MKTALPLLGLLSLAALITACDSPAVDYCDALCDCKNCSEREYDDCVRKAEDDAEHAYDRDCGYEYDTWANCVSDTYHCDGDDLEHDCKHEREDWRDCID